ncbi:MAG: undecaprenyl-phosphate glucose phosphotransferase, partial [Proteobacteria bacterium]|nr:undecaprenyl-phosphate glucose phosphotransferase [Pseudomonadota bacterium]
TLLRSHIATLILFTALTFFITEYRFSRGVILIYGVLFFGGAWAFRVVSRKILRELNRKGIRSTKVIAVGEGRDLEFILSQFARYPELGMEIDLKITPSRYAEALSLILSRRPKMVLVALPVGERGLLDSLVQALKDDSIDLHIIPDYSGYLAIGATTDSFGGVPVIAINTSPLFGYQAWIKRVMDLILSGVGLLILSPLLILLGILVKLSSRGPVLYRQERMGLDGGTFEMLKFRSMKADAEAATGAVWAVENDQRRTVFGTFLRSTSLDELPQLWNVFTGDMSLVGPRPERPVFVERFKRNIPNYMLRHRVKTGITGWAQVNGWRGDTSLEKRIECDIYYIRNWSLWLDVKILFLTVFKGFVNRNAY